MRKNYDFKTVLVSKLKIGFEMSWWILIYNIEFYIVLKFGGDCVYFGKDSFLLNNSVNKNNFERFYKFMGTIQEDLSITLIKILK